MNLKKLSLVVICAFGLSGCEVRFVFDPFGSGETQEQSETQQQTSKPKSGLQQSMPNHGKSIYSPTSANHSRILVTI